MYNIPYFAACFTQFCAAGAERGFFLPSARIVCLS
jgi:hypothetical protein